MIEKLVESNSSAWLRQETTYFDGRQQSLGSACYSQSKANSDYAGVIEQPGVKAGDGGFQAVSEKKNRVTARTLTESDIENRASYEAQSTSISGG